MGHNDHMDNQNGEIDRAVSALTTELLKLSAIEGEARDALCVTLENALSRLALALAAAQIPASPMPTPPPELSPPILTGPI